MKPTIKPRMPVKASKIEDEWIIGGTEAGHWSWRNPWRFNELEKVWFNDLTQLSEDVLSQAIYNAHKLRGES